jgi:hypothetical protein
MYNEKNQEINTFNILLLEYKAWKNGSYFIDTKKKPEGETLKLINVTFTDPWLIQLSP